MPAPDLCLPIIAVIGPTAAGKSDVAVRLALETGGEVVSADSMQVYRGFDIGTGKITAEEQQGVPHHLLDVVDAGEPFSAARFVELADAAIAGVVGGLPVTVTADSILAFAAGEGLTPTEAATLILAAELQKFVA